MRPLCFTYGAGVGLEWSMQGCTKKSNSFENKHKNVSIGITVTHMVMFSEYLEISSQLVVTSVKFGNGRRQSYLQFFNGFRKQCGKWTPKFAK